MKGRNFLPKNEVVNLLKQGWEIYSKRNEYFGNKNQLVYASRKYTIECENDSKLIHHSTIQSLQKSGVILNQNPYTFLQKH